MENWSLKVINKGKHKIKHSLVVIFKPNGLTETIDLLNTEGVITINDREYAIILYLEVSNEYTNKN